MHGLPLAKLSSAKIYHKHESNPKFLYLSGEIVVSGGHLLKEVLVEGFFGVTNYV